MLSLMRFRVPEDASGDSLRKDLRGALATLGRQKGFVRGHVGRATDDRALWLLATEWEGVGAYRRALSSYDVKVTAVPALSHALDEPAAFEVLDSADGPVTRSW